MFDTKDSDIVGYTSIRALDGMILPGATVLLEAPQQTALTPDANGQFVYAGSDTSLFAAALHEIGHVLGLGEDSDPNSAMYYMLGADNAHLNQTDSGAVMLRYGIDHPATPADGRVVG